MSVPAPTSDIRTAVDAALSRFLADRRAELAPLGSELAPLLDAADDFIANGKRLRPLFAVAGYQVATGSGTVPEPVAAAAASLEWLQASALVHDDLIDESDTRRGRPSMHRRFEAAHREQRLVGSANGFGTAAAVLLGDLMLSWCDAMLRGSGADHLDRALTILDACRNEVCAGQYLDVLAQTKEHVSAEDALRVVTYKSAKYTVERPLHLGAVIGGGDEQLLDRLSAAALPLGRAFQLRDDVLGVFGDPVVTGKPAGDDLREGKRTLLIARTRELTDDSGRALVAASLGTADGVDRLRDLIESSGALAAVETDITALAAQAEAAIATLGPAASAALTPLLNQAVQRHR